MNYKELKRKAMAAAKDGQAISLPVPVEVKNGDWADVFFVYTVNRETRIPNKPIYCIEIGEGADEVRLVEPERYFSDVAFQPTPYSKPNAFKDNVATAWEMYSRVRDEIVSGILGDASKKYAQLVRSVTQECLMPCYQALSPLLFSGV